MQELKRLNNVITKDNLQVKEQIVANLISGSEGTNYNEMLKGASWDTFCQLSSFREGLLNWYDFKEGSEILQISNGFGALTGLLARKGESVTVLETSEERARCIQKRYQEYGNISICIGEVEDLEEEERYDYIIVEKEVNTKNDLKELLVKACRFLKETGRLLFVCENRFGMKYWCGVPDPVSNIPFAGIRQSNTGRIMTRQDLINELENNTNINSFRLYYPFPDDKLPQAIYTDDYLPKTSVRDRVIPYYPMKQKKSLVCLESEICDDLIANGIFHIMANSFLVECSKCNIEKEVIFVALSTDRGEENGFATVIRSDNVVQKRNLHPLGRKSLERIYKNQETLLNRGVKCVKQVLLNNMIEMPYIQDKTMIEYLKKCFTSCPEKVKDAFDILYENILLSSLNVPFSECALHHETLNEKNAGKILSEAYIDMIPYNCFFIDGQILFYDQEFMKQNYPAKYVLFRALRYTYIYIQEAENIIPLEFFKKKYELNQVWGAFEEEEGRFIENNRNYEGLSSFYVWANVSRSDVDRNVQKLLRDDEKRNTRNYPIFKKKVYDLNPFKQDINLRNIKKVQLELLKVFAEVCEKNDLSYCAIYGTLLGAVRHKGFIPWDDDLDLAMPREDYDTLIEIAPEIFDEPYFLQTPENDIGCFYGGYSKLRNSNTTGLEKRNKNHVCNQGIWIDIFPLDVVPSNNEEKERQFGKVTFYQRLLLKKTYPERRMLWDLSQDQETEYLKLSKCFSKEELCRGLHDVIKNIQNQESDKIAIIERYRGGRKYTEYDKTDFEFLIKMQFEDYMILVPNGYENYLIKEYGMWYNLYPSFAERKPHHNAIFDPHKPYIDYIAENDYNNFSKNEMLGEI